MLIFEKISQNHWERFKKVYIKFQPHVELLHFLKIDSAISHIPRFDTRSEPSRNRLPRTRTFIGYQPTSEIKSRSEESCWSYRVQISIFIDQITISNLPPLLPTSLLRMHLYLVKLGSTSVHYDNCSDIFIKLSRVEQGPKIIANLALIINAKTRELTRKRDN